MKTAVRVANVPEDDFERQVESDNPPTITALAKQGTKKKTRPIFDLKGRDPDEFNRAMHFAGDIRQAAKLFEALDLDLDPASSSVANEKIGADKFFDEEADGLKREWRGRVWLNYGERSYGEMYAQAVDATGYENGTLRNAGSVSV